MSTTNDITGDSLTSRPATNAYRDNYDKIFGKNKTNKEQDLTSKIAQNKNETSNPHPAPKLK